MNSELGFDNSGVRTCPACGKRIALRAEIIVLVREGKPWLPEDHEDQSWLVTIWHRDCDRGSLAAMQAEDRQTALRGPDRR